MTNIFFISTDLNSGSVQGAGGFVILYFIVLFLLSIGLMVGVRTNIRGFMLPWIYTMYIAILFQAMFGLWLGMVSNKMTIVTTFGHSYFNLKSNITKFDFFFSITS